MPADPGNEPDPRVGRLLAGRYRIERFLAKGGMGRVYLATQLPLERKVAVKVLAPKIEKSIDPQFVRRFFLEAAVCSRLSHPNIVTVHDYGEGDNGELFMAMEYLDGTPLSTVIKTSGALAPERVVAIAIQICRALREAHARGVIHRDLKPGNIMMLRGDEEGGDVCKVLDFGLVKVFDSASEGGGESASITGEGMELTRAGILLGSPRYMSPEQIHNDALDPRTDIYSLGVIMHHITSGHPPYNGKTSVDILHQHLNREIPPIAGCPAELFAVIKRCMEKSREDRYATVSDLIKDLKAVHKSLGGAPFLVNSGGIPRSNSSSGSFAPAGPISSSGITTASPITGEISNPSISTSAPSVTASAPLAEPMPPSLASALAAPTSDLVRRDVSVTDGMVRPVSRDLERSTPVLMVAAGIVLGVALVVAGVLLSTAPPRPRESAPVTVAPVAPVAPIAPASPAEPPAAKKAASLLIESRPSGAIVREQGRVLGRTPLALPLDPNETQHRDFELSLSGHVSYAFRQPPENKDVRVLAELEPIAPEPAKKPNKPARPIARKTKDKPLEPPAPPDIRLAR
jgi:eukaryotic-like serine/threonine-protein kinase